jgi:hypothetical protein
MTAVFVACFREYRQYLNAGEAGRALAELAERTIPLGWTVVYQPMDVIGQSLEAVLRIEGPATAKLQIDEASPGARELAQALDAKIEGGMYDALALCVYQAKEDVIFPPMRSK